MIITTKTINKHNNSIDLSRYSKKQIEGIFNQWNFIKNADLEIDLWTGKQNMSNGDIVKIDICEIHDKFNQFASLKRTGYVYVYYSNDTQHYIQKKKIYANTKGLYIEFDGRTYLELSDIEVSDD